MIQCENNRREMVLKRVKALQSSNRTGPRILPTRQKGYRLHFPQQKLIRSGPMYMLSYKSSTNEAESMSYLMRKPAFT